MQRELADVRVLARAARAARDAAALQALQQWLRETGYRDSVTEGILGDERAQLECAREDDYFAALLLCLVAISARRRPRSRTPRAPAS